MRGHLQLNNKPVGNSGQLTQKRPNRCMNIVIDLLQEFSQKSNIHGVDRALNRNTSRFRRLLWVFAFSVDLTALIMVCMLVAARYNRQQFESVIATTEYPIYKVPFPEITICNRNRLNWALLPRAQRIFLRKVHQTTKHAAEFAKIMATFDTLNFAEFEHFGNLSHTALQEFNYLDFVEVIKFMSWRCADIFAECQWEDKLYNCCDIFFPRKSLMGYCLAFNTIESKEGRIKQFQDEKWPWRTAGYAQNSGLRLKVYLRDDQHSPFSDVAKGVEVMIVEPSVWFDYGNFINKNTYVQVSIDPEWHFLHESLRSLTTQRRQCVYENDYESEDYKTLKDHDYMWENCVAQCYQTYLMKYCNCTMSLFYPTGPYPTCKLTDLPCLAQHNDLFQFTEVAGEEEYVSTNRTGMECNCLLNCISLNYKIDIRTTWLPESKLVENNSVIDIRFYFRKDFALVYETHLVYTWVDLLVSFGGIAGLCLGCSVISLIEILYFWLIDATRIVSREWQNERIQRKFGERRKFKIRNQ